MKLVGLKNLCYPAFFYLVLNLFALIIISYQNYGNMTTYCIGPYGCDVTNITLVFIIKAIYVIFWTWILNLICAAGYPIISWILVLFPFLLLFLFIPFVLNVN